MDEYINYEPPKTPLKELFYDAFYSLMKEKPICEIGIDELSERAGLSRRTFYRHFSLIDDRLRSQTDFFIRHFSRHKPTDYTSLAKVCFEHCAYFNKEFLLILKKNNKLELYLQYLFVKTSFLMAEIFERKGNRTCADTYVPHFIIGSLYGVLLSWLKSGMITDVKGMCDAVSHIINSDLLTLTGNAKPP